MITPKVFPRVLQVGNDGNITPYTDEPWSEIERDPRGVLLMWEPPRRDRKYIMGLDPTHGITGWTRGTRVDGDKKTDNGAIEIFEVDGVVELATVEDASGQQVPDIDAKTGRQRRLYRDLQVAEFAAPCDAVEIARIANILGRIYAGDEDDQCELIYEAWPGPGILTTQELIRLGYGNLWMWEYIDAAVEESNRPGWRSSNQSQRMLWYRARRHLMNRQAVIQSKFLLAEYSNAEIDIDKMRARASSGYHDDRFQAANMCFWAGHKWMYNVERTEEKVTANPIVDYQSYAPTLDDHMSFEEWKQSVTDEWS